MNREGKLPDINAEPVNAEARVAPASELEPTSEDILRAQLYRMLARFLAHPPSQDDLQSASLLSGDSSPLGKAVAAFSAACKEFEPDEFKQDYHDLFIGVVRGELLPFASYYLTGFLHEKPLAKLRNDMARLGIERNPDIKEPEDHIAALMDMMAGLILGEYGEMASVKEQRQFFETHISPWADYFFADLEGQSISRLYAALGNISRRFMEIEVKAFQMA